ncbi:CBL-interacting protein kinase 2-like [Euphorbia lathyris]|uniref:CBL-interacting protein kinase 2-like n=1 Tax=Euphorbia lathyris TaxID=212925 RepID=UPI003313F5B6
METKGHVLMQKYEIGKLLGQGTFARVHHARDLRNGRSVAIKIIDKEKVFKVGMIEQIKREISVMRLIRHPNVVELYEVLATKTRIYFVMEYVKGGELFNKVAKGKLREDVARKYFQQLISAVDYCHSRGVCHRDLKPENLLLDENGNLKVSDFGLSSLAECKRQDGLLHTTCGTPAYVAPEVIIRKGYDGSKADIWSCGVILFVLMAGYLPFHDTNLMEMYKKIGKAEFKFPNWFPPEVRKLLSKILDPNPKKRISMAKIMENYWFCKGLESRPLVVEMETKEPAPLVGCDAIFNENESSCTLTESKQEVVKPCNLNAFDIISYSSGFDLSGLFEEKYKKKEVRFTANKPVAVIISKLEEIAKGLRLKIKKRDGGLLKMEGTKAGRKGVLGVDAEIFEITPVFHLVEMKKSSGDTMEYEKVLKEEIRPGLKDVVWSWQGEQQQQQQVEPEPEQEQEQPEPQPSHPYALNVIP